MVCNIFTMFRLYGDLTLLFNVGSGDSFLSLMYALNVMHCLRKLQALSNILYTFRYGKTACYTEYDYCHHVRHVGVRLCPKCLRVGDLRKNQRELRLATMHLKKSVRAINKGWMDWMFTLLRLRVASGKGLGRDNKHDDRFYQECRFGECLHQVPNILPPGHCA